MKKRKSKPARACCGAQKIPFKLIPKNRKLLKSSRVRKYLRECEKVIYEHMAHAAPGPENRPVGSA